MAKRSLGWTKMSLVKPLSPEQKFKAFLLIPFSTEWTPCWECGRVFTLKRKKEKHLSNSRNPSHFTPKKKEIMRSLTILFVESKSYAACLLSVSLKAVWRNMEEHAAASPLLKTDMCRTSCLHLPCLSDPLHFCVLTSAWRAPQVFVTIDRHRFCFGPRLLSFFITLHTFFCFTSSLMDCSEMTVDGRNYALRALTQS